MNKQVISFMFIIFAVLQLKLCYHEGSSSGCNSEDTNITKTNCSSLLKLCEVSSCSELIIKVVEDMSENVMISIGEGSVHNVEVQIFGDISERLIHLDGVANENVSILAFGKGNFDVQGNVQVSTVDTSNDTVFLTSVNMSRCSITKLFLSHLSKVSQGINLIIYADQSLSVSYNQNNWTINSIVLFHSDTIPTILVDLIDSVTLSITKNAQLIYPIQLKAYRGYKSITVLVDDSWDSLKDQAIMLEGYINMIIQTKSWIIPVCLGSTISDMLTMNIDINKIDGCAISNYTFGPFSYHSDGISQETSITFNQKDCPVYLESFTFGFKLVYLSTGMGSPIQLLNVQFLPNAYSKFNNVLFIDSIVSMKTGSQIQLFEVDLSNNVLEIGTNLYNGQIIDCLSKTPSLYIDNHPKKIVIIVNVSTYSGSYYNGKNDKTSLLIEFAQMDPSIMDYTEIRGEEIHKSNYLFDTALEIGEKTSMSYRSGIRVNYTIIKLPDQTANPSSPPITLFPTETQLPPTPIETQSPTQSSFPNNSNKSFFASSAFKIASGCSIILIIVFVLYLFFKKDDSFDLTGNSLIV